MHGYISKLRTFWPRCICPLLTGSYSLWKEFALHVSKVFPKELFPKVKELTFQGSKSDFATSCNFPCNSANQTLKCISVHHVLNKRDCPSIFVNNNKASQWKNDLSQFKFGKITSLMSVGAAWSASALFTQAYLSQYRYLEYFTASISTSNCWVTSVTFDHHVPSAVKKRKSKESLESKEE